MSYSDPNQNPIPETYIPSNSNEAEKLKLYQAFIFSVPICFTFIVLFVLYVIYLRRNSTTTVDWSSLGMRGGTFIPTPTNDNLAMVELGLSKDLREMLPIVIFKESFSVKDSQCSVCLGDYQANEKLQQMPTCGHTFHMECIDLWLTSHTTCPLCRLSLIAKPSINLSHDTPENVSSMENSNVGGDLTQPESQSTTEEVSHINDGQEGNQDSQEVSKENEENNQNSVGTSNGCCTCRLGKKEKRKSFVLSFDDLLVRFKVCCLVLISLRLVAFLVLK